MEVIDKAGLLRHGCGGLLGINRGSAEPPAMIKLTYRAGAGDGRDRAAAHLALVGKGIMYDSGGIASSRATPSMPR